LSVTGTSTAATTASRIRATSNSSRISAEPAQALHAFYGEQAGVRIARKHLGWYAKDRPENRAFLAVVNRAQTAQEQLRSTRDYFDALAAGVKPELPAAA